MQYLMPFLKGFGAIAVGIVIVTAFFWGVELALNEKPENEYDWADRICLWFAGGIISLTLLAIFIYGCILVGGTI